MARPDWSDAYHYAFETWAHGGGLDVTEETIRNRLIERRLILQDHEYRESGVERIPGTSKLTYIGGSTHGNQNRSRHRF